MKSQEIQKHIDRVVGTEGTLRIPSWWMHKILSDIVRYCEGEGNGGADDLRDEIYKGIPDEVINFLKEKGVLAAVEEGMQSINSSVQDIDERVNALESRQFIIILNELPENPKSNTIYLIPSLNGQDHNVLTEWAFINGTWEQFGEFKADIDLSDYAKKGDIVIPDWNASLYEDGHIKNRTHYIDYPLCILNKDNRSSEIGSFGQVYVAYNDTVEILKERESLPLSGNLVKLEYDNYTVSLVEEGEGFIDLLINHDIRIFGFIRKLEDVFIPDTIARKSDLENIEINSVTPDWNASFQDLGYISNKPFGFSYETIMTEVSKNYYAETNLIYYHNSFKHLTLGDNQIGTELILNLSKDDGDFIINARYITSSFDFKVYIGCRIDKLDLDYLDLDTLKSKIISNCEIANRSTTINSSLWSKWGIRVNDSVQSGGKYFAWASITNRSDFINDVCYLGSGEKVSKIISCASGPDNGETQIEGDVLYTLDDGEIIKLGLIVEKNERDSDWQYWRIDSQLF